MLRAYIMLRHYAEHGEVKFSLGSHPKYRAMLLAVHSVAALGNGGKVALMQGNPLAINLAEWMALLRYLIPSLKYWLLDRQLLELEHLQRLSDSGWRDLQVSSLALLEQVSAQEPGVILLGGAA